MSIDCNIIVEDDTNRICIYRRRFGYPDSLRGVLATLDRANYFAWGYPSYEAADFAAALVAAWKPQGGGGIYLMGKPKNKKTWQAPVAFFDYLIRPPDDPSKDQRYSEMIGDPLVEVLDFTPQGWHAKLDTSKLTLKPHLTMPLSMAKEVGLKMNP